MTFFDRRVEIGSDQFLRIRDDIGKSLVKRLGIEMKVRFNRGSGPIVVVDIADRGGHDFGAEAREYGSQQKREFHFDCAHTVRYEMKDRMRKIKNPTFLGSGSSN